MSESKGVRYFQFIQNEMNEESSEPLSETEKNSKKKNRSKNRLSLRTGESRRRSKQLRMERRSKDKRELSIQDKRVAAAIRGDLPPKHMDISKKQWTEALQDYAERMKLQDKPIQKLSNKERELVELEIMARNRGWAAFPSKERKVCYICGLGNVTYPSSCPHCSHFVNIKDAEKPLQLCFRCGATSHSFDQCKISYRELKQEYKNLNAICMTCDGMGHVNCKRPHMKYPPRVACARCGETVHFFTICMKSLPSVKYKWKPTDKLKFIDDEDLKFTPLKNPGDVPKIVPEQRWFLRKKIDPVLSSQSKS